jgi:tetratricopeptide (TPR) repeat protein
MLRWPWSRGSPSLSSLCAVVVGLASLSSGCAPVRPPRAITPAERVEEARAEGLSLENPLEIDADMKRAVDRSVGRHADPASRLRHLARFLTDSGFVNFQYVSNQSLTARQAFRQRRGDCMAYTNLFMALARYLGIDAYFVHVREVSNYYERGGYFFVSSHVAVGYGQGPAAEVVDFAKEISDWKLALYSVISDDAALALYYNNVAVDHMLGGRTREAEHLFRFWLAREPNVAELYNNLGVLLNRRKRHDEALRVLLDGIRRFPSYAPLFTNGLNAARGAGRPELAREFEERGKEIEHADPFFLFARALRFYHADRYAEATPLFEQAMRRKPDSPVLVAWLTRALLASGRRAEGLEMFERVKEMAPADPLLRDLREQFPELR